MKMDPKQVHMAPFRLIFIQDGSHKLWEASGMPPGPQNATGKSQNPGFHCFFFKIFQYFPLFSDHPSTATGLLLGVCPSGQVTLVPSWVHLWLPALRRLEMKRLNV